MHVMCDCGPRSDAGDTHKDAAARRSVIFGLGKAERYRELQITWNPSKLLRVLYAVSRFTHHGAVGAWVGAAVSEESGGLASHLYEPCGCVPHSVTTLITTPGHWTACAHLKPAAATRELGRSPSVSGRLLGAVFTVISLPFFQAMRTCKLNAH